MPLLFFFFVSIHAEDNKSPSTYLPTDVLFFACAMCMKAYRHLRKSAHQYLNLLSLMSGAGIKDLSDDPAAVLQLVRDRTNVSEKRGPETELLENVSTYTQVITGMIQCVGFNRLENCPFPAGLPPLTEKTCAHRFRLWLENIHMNTERRTVRDTTTALEGMNVLNEVLTVKRLDTGLVRQCQRSYGGGRD